MEVKIMSETKGRVTIPTDLDVIPETLKMLDEWGADAIRDCDGTCLGEGTSGRDPADVYHDIFSHGSFRYSGDTPDGPSVSGYACCQYQR